MFRTLAIHDAVWGLFAQGKLTGVTLGRWLQGIIVTIDKLFISNSSISSPGFEGFITFFTIAVMICVLAELFNMNNRISLAVLCGYSVTNASILMLFGYLGFAYHYVVGVLLAVAASWVLCTKERSVKYFLLGTFLLYLATAEYQCFFAIGMTIMLLYMIKRAENIDGGGGYHGLTIGELLFIFLAAE